MTPTRLPFLPANLTFKNSLFSTLAQAAACLLLTVGLVGGTAVASAQTASTSAESASPQWQENFDEQVAPQLRQESSMRATLIQVVIEEASRDEDLNLPRTTEALLHVIENDTSQKHRLLAIQALSVIGPEHAGEKRYEEAMSRLYTLAEKEQSEQVRKGMISVIDRYQTS